MISVKNLAMRLTAGGHAVTILDNIRLESQEKQVVAVTGPWAAPYTLTFYPKEANIYSWQDTGEIAATAIFDCPSKVGNQQWPKTLSAIAFDDPRERLEAGRAGTAS